MKLKKKVNQALKTVSYQLHQILEKTINQVSNSRFQVLDSSLCQQNQETMVYSLLVGTWIPDFNRQWEQTPFCGPRPRPRHWTHDRDFGPATATLDPRPRLWTRDPLPATISQTPLSHNIARYDRCIIHYIRQMYLNLEKAVFKFSFFTQPKHCLV